MIDENRFKKIDKSERSSFPYWFNHWKAFNAVAIELGVWKSKYLFHDIEKPFLKLFLKDYNKVQKWHRTHNRHHLEYKGKKDYEAMVIDWECSRHAKKQCLRNAIQEAGYKHGIGEMLLDEYSKFIKIARKLGLAK